MFTPVFRQRIHAPLRRFMSAVGHMDAMVLSEPGPVANMTFQRVPLPSLVAPNQVKVRVAACAVCHRDLLDRKGAFPFIHRPTILGHELAGQVVEAGQAVANLAVGDNVVSLHWSSCGTCAACREGRPTHCADNVKSFFGLTVNGGYAEYTVNGSNAFVKVPAGWSAVEAAPVMCTYGTVWHAALTRGRLRPSERVLITGASGGVGSAAVQLIAAMGCHVIAVTSSAAKVEYLKSLGAHDIIVTDAGSSQFHKHPAARNVDMAFEAVGEPTFTSSLRSLRAGGRLVLVGNVTASTASLPLGLAIVRGLEIIGSDSVSPAELDATFKFLDVKGIRPRIDHTLALNEACKAHDDLECRHVSGRIVLKLREDW